MRAGKLNRVIYVERKVADLDAAGYAVPVWSLVGTVRAEIINHAIDEAATDLGEAGTAGVTFQTRYFGGLTTADRIRFLGRHYNVTAIAEIGIRAGLEIKAQAIE